MAGPALGNANCDRLGGCQSAIASLPGPVFKKALRDVAGEIQTTAMKCIYAGSPDEAKQLNAELRQMYERFNEMAASTLPELY
jgi:hypothetical protein